MLKTLALTIALFTSIATAGIVGNIASAQESKPAPESTEPVYRLLPSFINCTDINTLNSVISKYDELPLLKGKGMILIPGQAGSFENELRMYVNPKTGSFSVVLMLDENAGCMVVIGKDFTPWIDKTQL